MIKNYQPSEIVSDEEEDSLPMKLKRLELRLEFLKQMERDAFKGYIHCIAEDISFSRFENAGEDLDKIKSDIAKTEEEITKTEEDLDLISDEKFEHIYTIFSIALEKVKKITTPRQLQKVLRDIFF